MSYTPTNWASTDVVTASRMNALEQAVGEIDMSYTPNVWQDGDVLTASKMNALEQAVASGGGASGAGELISVTLISTSEVGFTITGTTWNDDFNVYIVNALIPIDESHWSYENYIEGVINETMNCLFFGGSFKLTYSGNDVAVTGNATVSEDEGYIVTITGDCTITLS